MKIVQVINTIISNKEKITEIKVDNKEFYFLYNNKTKWSVEKTYDDYREDYIVNFYPDDPDNIVPSDLDDIISDKGFGILTNFASYSARDLGTVEAYETFKDLFDILFDRIYGINDTFDSILADDLL